jgi:hypothetical protein
MATCSSLINLSNVEQKQYTSPQQSDKAAWSLVHYQSLKRKRDGSIRSTRLQPYKCPATRTIKPKPGRQIEIAAARSVMCSCSRSRSLEANHAEDIYRAMAREARNHRAQVLDGVQGGTTAYVQILIGGSRLLWCICSFSRVLLWCTLLYTEGENMPLLRVAGLFDAHSPLGLENGEESGLNWTCECLVVQGQSISSSTFCFRVVWRASEQ